MPRYVTVIPAYGRDYTEEADALADWNAEKDFLIQDFELPSQYINRQQVPRGWEISIRFNRLEDTVKAS
jgi:hypothetical protein